MGKVAFLFPGQGAQRIGMGKELYNNFPEAQKIFNLADHILGFKLSNLCFQGSMEELTKTENTQPALFITSMAILESFRSRIPLKEDACAGHSLGEYTALVASGALSFEDGLQLVYQRGKLMANADPDHFGTMAAIIGLDQDKVELLCKKYQSEGIVVLSNYNAPGQYIISGQKSVIEMICQEISKSKAKTIPLNVSGAFHSPLMESAALHLSSFIDKINFMPPLVMIISNVTGRPIEKADVKKELVNQITSPVRWIDSMQYLIKNEFKVFIEFGNNSTLCKFLKKINNNVTTMCVSDLNSLEETVDWIVEHHLLISGDQIYEN